MRSPILGGCWKDGGGSSVQLWKWRPEFRPASVAASRGWGPGQADESLGGASWSSQTPEDGEAPGGWSGENVARGEEEGPLVVGVLPGSVGADSPLPTGLYGFGCFPPGP